MAARFKSKLEAKLTGDRIRAARRSRHLTLKKLAEKTKVHHSQISRMEHGQVETLSKNVQKICKYLQVNLDYAAIEPPTPAASIRNRIEEFLGKSPANAEVLRTLLDAVELLST